MTIDLANWMDSVSGSKKLSELSIPGTHDSASRYIDPTVHDDDLSPRLTTQTASIRDQLDSGIRFLDIRVGYTQNVFKLYHENVYLDLNFGPVRDVCKNFLQSHPKETIIMSLKKEDGAPTSGNVSTSFQARFRTYVKESPDLWYTSNAIPTLSDARGKIVLFRRFDLKEKTPAASASQRFGINAFNNFPNNATGTIGTTAMPPKLKIQDYFDQTGANDTKAKKLTMVEALLDDASKADSDQDTLYLNFGSAAGIVDVDFPLSVANYINPRLITYFNNFFKENQNRTGRFGIVAMDFQTIELNRLIVRTNGIAS